MSEGVAGGPAAGADSEVRDALVRVLDSQQFRRAPQSRGFLAYVVTEKLAGRGDRLSERTIGRSAMSRPADFDGRESAVVRVQANRVRAALDRYYAAHPEERIRFQLAPGSYVPVIESRPADAPDAAVIPGVAVMVLSAGGDEPAPSVAAALSDAIAHHLSAHPELRVVGPTTGRGDPRATGRALGVTTVLEGRVAIRGGKVRLTARLLSASSGEVLWSHVEVAAVDQLLAFDTEDVWAREIAGRIGDVDGIVVRESLHGSRAAAPGPETSARVAFYGYLAEGSDASVRVAVERLDIVLATGSRSAPLLAMRGALHNAAATRLAGAAAREESAKAAERARESLALDGGCVHAHLVLAAAEADHGRWESGAAHARRAVALAPYQPTYLVGAGITLIRCGDRDGGSALVREGHRLNPALPPHIRTWLAVAHLADGDYAQALVEAGALPSEGYVWGPLYRSISLAGLGRFDEAAREAEQVRASRPEILDHPAEYFASRMRLTADELARVIEPLRHLP